MEGIPRNIVCIIITFALTANFVSSTLFGHIYFAERILDTGTGGVSSFEIIPNLAIKQCIERCKQRKNCAFVNFYINGHVCYLMQKADDSTGYSTQAEVGFLYSMKSDWDMTENAGCDTCDVTETCSTQNGTTSCTTESCIPPQVSVNMTVQGNIYTVGTRLRLSCDDSDVVGATSASIVCETTGQWQAHDVSCVSASFCPDALPSEYQSRILEDMTNVTFRYFRKEEKYWDMLRICEDDGASLMQTFTLVKTNFIRNVMKCTGYSKEDIMIDGVYNLTTGVWESSDHKPLPTSRVFWKDGEVDSDLQDGRCVEINKDDGLFYNHSCKKDRSFFCEKR